MFDAVYYAWDSSGNGFAFDISKSELTPIDLQVSGGVLQRTSFFDSYSNTLYTRDISDSALRSWRPRGDATHTTPAPWSWTSKEFYVPDRSYGALKITGILSATDYVSVAIIIDNTITVLGNAVDDTPFRLPAVRGAKYKVKIELGAGNPIVHTLQVGVHPTEFV